MNQLFGLQHRRRDGSAEYYETRQNKKSHTALRRMRFVWKATCEGVHIPCVPSLIVRGRQHSRADGS